MVEARVVRKWSMEGTNIRNILVVPESGELDIAPGDFVYLDDIGLPIIDYNKTQNGVKLSVVYEGELPDVRFVEFSKPKPRKGIVLNIGKLPNPIVAILRQNGYEVSEYTEKKPSAVIITEPLSNTIPNSEKVIFAPHDNLTLSDYHYMNKILEEKNIGILYNLNKPLLMKSNTEIDVLYFSMKLFLPSNINAYVLKVKNGKILGFVNTTEPILAVSDDDKIIVASSVKLFYPYDLLIGRGQNSRFILNIIESEIKLPKTGEKTKKKSKILVVEDSNTVQIDLGNLTETEAFNFVLERLLKLGGVLLQRNDSTKSARILFSLNGDQGIDLSLRIRGGKLLMSTTGEKSGKELRSLRSLMQLVEVMLIDLRNEKLKRNELKMIIRLVSNVYKRLLIIKDMVEVEMNSMEIANELSEVIGLLRKADPLKKVADEIDEYVNNNFKEIELDKPLDENLKADLMKKIDDWYNSITDSIESFI